VHDRPRSGSAFFRRAPDSKSSIFELLLNLGIGFDANAISVLMHGDSEDAGMDTILAVALLVASIRGQAAGMKFEFEDAVIIGFFVRRYLGGNPAILPSPAVPLVIPYC
jgi:hypothetical protein